MLRVFGILFLVILTSTSLSCKKNTSFSKNHLNFSQDTLVFDTIFTTVGSTTKQLKIYNFDNEPIRIESISLKNGSNSPFRLNVDGKADVNFSNLEIAPNDSIYAFVDVKLSVNNQNLPMVVEDEIEFTTNSKTQVIQLAVWGQDIHYHYSDILNGTVLDFKRCEVLTMIGCRKIIKKKEEEKFCKDCIRLLNSKMIKNKMKNSNEEYKF